MTKIKLRLRARLTIFNFFRTIFNNKEMIRRKKTWILEVFVSIVTKTPSLIHKLVQEIATLSTMMFISGNDNESRFS